MSTAPTKRARIRPADAAELSDYFQSSASELGFRSAHGSIVDLIANSGHMDDGGRSNGVENAMVRRLDRSGVKRHRLVRAALQILPLPLHDALFMAHGVPDSALPLQVRRAFGMVGGVVLLTTAFRSAYEATLTSGRQAGHGLEWLEKRCSSSGNVVFCDSLREAAEQALAEAHAAYSAARDQQDPERAARRKVPARAAGGYGRAASAAARIRDEVADREASTGSA